MGRGSGPELESRLCLLPLGSQVLGVGPMGGTEPHPYLPLAPPHLLSQFEGQQSNTHPTHSGTLLLLF